MIPELPPELRTVVARKARFYERFYVAEIGKH